MIALGGPKLKRSRHHSSHQLVSVSMIALGGPKLKLQMPATLTAPPSVSMIALGGPKLKLAGTMRTTRALKFQ